MKKTLALLLALITLLTVSLASCSKKEGEEIDPNGDFNFVFDDNASAKPTETDKDGNVITDKDTNTNDFIAASGTTYILHPVKVREKAKNSSATIGVADWGSAVELVERNQTWTKIKFTDKASGAVLEGYVRNELLTGDKGSNYGCYRSRG
jgi:hypothetical protein